MRQTRFVLACMALAIGLPEPVAAQDDLMLPSVHIPRLPAKARNAAAFVPRGWTLEQQARGDLDRDGRPDLAMLLRATAWAGIVRGLGFCSEAFDTNPRILAVALARGGGFELAVHKADAIPRPDNPCAVDEHDLAISRGALRLSISRFMSAGGWGASTSIFNYRWQDRALRLIGYDHAYTRRNTGERSTLSINFLSGKLKTTKGSISDDREIVRWSRWAGPRVLTIDDVEDPWMFDPGGLVSTLP